MKTLTIREMGNTSGVTLVWKVGNQARGVLIKWGSDPYCKKWGPDIHVPLKLRPWGSRAPNILPIGVTWVFGTHGSWAEAVKVIIGRLTPTVRFLVKYCIYMYLSPSWLCRAANFAVVFLRAPRIRACLQITSYFSCTRHITCHMLRRLWS